MRPCHHEQLRRSKRSRREHLGALLRLRPYRCRTCGTRVWRYCGRWYVDLPVLGALGAAVYFLMPLMSGGPHAVARAPRLAVQPAELAWPDATPQPTATLAVLAAAPTPRTTPAPSPRAAATAAPTTPRPTPSAAVHAAARPQILDLGHSSRDGRFELHIRHNRDTLQPKLERLSSPDRLLLDLPGRWEISTALLAARPVAGDVVSRIRLGRHADKLRIVLDLQARPADIRHRLKALDGEIRWTLAAAAE